MFDRAGVGYIVSTGGQGGVFTCATDEGMERFIARYASAHLLGIDFDQCLGQPLARVVPEMAPLVQEALALPERQVEAQIRLLTRGNATVLLVRIASLW